MCRFITMRYNAATMYNIFRQLLSITGLAFLVACASYPLNAPIDEIKPASGYRLTNRTLGDQNSDETFVILALSGGGARAAALDFGVIQQLDRVRLDDDGRTLLDEVDVISSSSGASIPAAYYGLHGKDVFLRDFTDDVLYLQMQSGITRRVFNPMHWPRLMSGTFSRGDLIVEYLDEKIFEGHTFADMQQQRPLILMNATDIGIGSQFSFTQGAFDQLCSDLSQFHVARAVTASMAFTPAFTPITLKNYNDGRCGDTVPGWVYQAMKIGVEDNPSVFAMAESMSSTVTVSRKWLTSRSWMCLRSPRNCTLTADAPACSAKKAAKIGSGLLALRDSRRLAIASRVTPSSIIRTPDRLFDDSADVLCQ